MWPALLTGLTSLAGTGISLSQQSKENEKTRQYNLQLAKMQNEENFKNWQSQNAYNDPSAQINRLRNAGINPDLFYGNGQMSNIAGNIHPSSSGAPANPIDWSSLRTNPVESYLDAQLKQAQIDNINADTGKKGAETSILTDQAAFTRAIQQGQLDLQNAQINLIGKQGNLTEQEITESQQRCLSIEASTKQIYANIDKINTDIDVSKKISDAQLRQMAAQTNLSYAQAKNILTQLPEVINKLKSETANNNASANLRIEELGHLELRKDSVAFDARVKARKGYSSDLSVWQNVMSFLAQITDTIGLP